MIQPGATSSAMLKGSLRDVAGEKGQLFIKQFLYIHKSYIINTLKFIMSLKFTAKAFQIFSIGALFLSVWFLWGVTTWSDTNSTTGFYSLIASVFSSIVLIFIPTSFTKKFGIDDWGIITPNNPYYLEVKRSQHGRGKLPQVQVFMANGNLLETVFINSYFDDKGNLTLSITSNPFIGKVVIT